MRGQSKNNQNANYMIHIYRTAKVQTVFYFFKKVSNVRVDPLTLLTNMESLGIWKWILGLSINP